MHGTRERSTTAWHIPSKILVFLTTMSACLSLPLAANCSQDYVVDIYVLDEATRAPIAYAEVTLFVASRQYSGVTDRHGEAHFSDILPGSYTIKAYEPDYKFINSALTVQPSNSAALVRVLGVRTRLRVIGASRAVQPSGLNPAEGDSIDMPAAELSGSVGSSLGSMSSLNASESVLPHGESQALETATINGAPLFPSSTKLTAGLFTADIFSSASLAGNVVGSPSGTLDFKTYEPVIDWMGLAQTRVGSFGAEAYSFQERGTSGRIGVSFAHSQNTHVTALNDSIFTDTSGLTYLHDTSDRSTGDTASFRYASSDNNVTHLDIGRISEYSTLNCNVDSGPIPCGIGPGNFSQESVSYVQLRDEFVGQKLQIDSNLFRADLHDNIFAANDFVENENEGFTSSSIAQRSGVILKTSYPISANRMTTVTLSDVIDQVKNSGTGLAEIPITQQSGSHSSIFLEAPVSRSKRFQTDIEIGSNASQSISAISYGADARYLTSSKDTLSLAYTAGLLSSPLGTLESIASPATLTVDCASREALGNGTTTDQSAGRTQQINSSYVHESNSYQVTADVYAHISRDSPVSAAVPAVSLPSALFSPDYLTSADTFATRECGRPTQISLASLAFTETATVSTLLNDGLDVGSKFFLTNRSQIGFGYSLSVQRALGSSPLFVAGSSLHAGALLPGATVSRLNTTARYALSRSTTAIANINVFGSNNPYGPDAFATADLGIRSSSGTSDFVFAAQNVTNQHGDGFSRFNPYPNLRQPFGPRTFSVRVRISLGRQNIDRADFLTKPIAPKDPSLFYIPLDYSDSAAQSSLLPATDSEICGPESRPKAAAYLAALSAFLKNERVSDSSQTFDGMTLEKGGLLPNGTVRIVFERGTKDFGPFLKCSRIHTGYYNQAISLGIYIPPIDVSDADAIYTLYYDTSVGLYYPPEPEDITRKTLAGAVRGTALPERTPPNPFAISNECPKSLTPAFQDASRDIQQFADAYYKGNSPSEPLDFLISPHISKAERWLEIRPLNLELSGDLAACLNAPIVSRFAIAKRGLGGAFPPSINYAPSVGFYVQSP